MMKAPEGRAAVRIYIANPFGNRLEFLEARGQP
jgi:hypothetical protein